MKRLLVILLLLLTACKPLPPGEVPHYIQGGKAEGTVVDGIYCIVWDGHQAGGISCDFANASGRGGE